MSRRHLVMLVCTWVLILGVAAYWMAEGNRRATAAEHRLTKEIGIGGQTYAVNCMRCHGPVGEGVIGLPLNVAQFRGDPHEEADTYDFLVKTIKNGRAGKTGAAWEHLPDGRIASYSQMPPWAKSEGGALTEEEITAVATFIMAGNWEDTFYAAPEPTLQNSWPELERLPADKAATAQDLILEKGCLSCHKIGNKGGEIGPDLSHVAAWMPAKLLRQWLENPQGLKPEQRGPSIWFQGAEKELGQAWMPRIPLGEPELDLLVEYLQALQ